MLALSHQFSSSFDSDLDSEIPAHYEIQQGSSPLLFDGFLSDSSDDDCENRYPMPFAIDLTPTNENATFDLKGDLAVANHVKSPFVDKTSPSGSQSSEETIRSCFSGLFGFLSSSSSSDEESFDHPLLSNCSIEDLPPTKELTSSKLFKPTPKPLPETKLESGGTTYTVHGVLGKGSFGEVVYALSSRGEQVAIKVCGKATNGDFSSMLSDIIMNERDILVKIATGDSPFLNQPLACFQDDDNVYFVMRLYTQNLAQRIFPFDAQPLEAPHIKLFAAELLLGMQSLHELGVVHRDLKPDNILITPNGHLAIADFGLSKQFFAGRIRRHMKMFERWGTNGYFAPELIPHTCITEGYTGAVDVWGYGIILYEILLRKRCVNANTPEGQTYMNQQLATHIHDDIDRLIGKNDAVTADLLNKILQADPTRRPSWATIQQHEYFAGVDWAAVAGREGHCDVPVVALKGLKPYFPLVTDGVKFKVEDCSLNFESDKPDRAHSNEVHGTASIQ